MRSRIILLFILVTMHIPALFAQQNLPPVKAGQNLRIYLEGEVEDMSYQKRNINYVDFVNDPKLADVQVIATELTLGSGGRKYFLNFYSGDKRETSDFKLSFIHEPNDTDDTDRIRFRKTLEIGLLHYLSETPQIDRFDIGYKGSEDEPRQVVTAGKDPWNFWVFRLTGTGGWEMVYYSV